MRTQEEIVSRINSSESEDFMGTQRSDLLGFLEFQNAKEFLKPEATEEDWAKVYKSTDADVKKEMLDYMEFAWGKANDMRGLSAGRSIDHYTAWIWLLGDEELQKKFEETEYEHYGKEKLIVVCEHFGWDYKKWDDGVRTNG